MGILNSFTDNRGKNMSLQEVLKNTSPLQTFCVKDTTNFCNWEKRHWRFLYFVRYEVFKAMKTEVGVFWVAMLCSDMPEYSSLWRWWQQGPPNHWYPTSLHCITVQKNMTRILTFASACLCESRFSVVTDTKNKHWNNLETISTRLSLTNLIQEEINSVQICKLKVPSECK